MPDPEDLEEMFEHMDDPQELNFDNDDYVEIDENDWSEPYNDLDNLLDDADALASAGWGTDEDYGYFGGDDF
tara:strand:+ start:465 stop:680 length:216 start_codon:yes stop_codon:yes gene_type:complete